mmetsp:Transcript_23753/g.48814  ORF Transcript_23753/g.48814 Transcript_23753/m.48814 type:complete len:200 (+) Transcript_23753:490-1089(+)
MACSNRQITTPGEAAGSFCSVLRVATRGPTSPTNGMGLVAYRGPGFGVRPRFATAPVSSIGCHWPCWAPRPFSAGVALPGHAFARRPKMARSGTANRAGSPAPEKFRGKYLLQGRRAARLGEEASCLFPLRPAAPGLPGMVSDHGGLAAGRAGAKCLRGRRLYAPGADEAEGGKQASRHRSVGSHGALSRGSCADRERR